MSIPILPIEMWACVAMFIPFGDRLRVFNALDAMGLLPDTGTHRVNAFLQFCSESDAVERYMPEPTYYTEEDVRDIASMGFSNESVRHALSVSPSLDVALELLLLRATSVYLEA